MARVVPGIQSSVEKDRGWSGSERKQVNDWHNWDSQMLTALFLRDGVILKLMELP